MYGETLAHTGPGSSMKAACRWLFCDWLVHSGFEPASGPVVEEYLNSPRDTALIDIAGKKAGQIMLVPTALMVDAFIRTVPRGRSLSARQLRDAMAAAHGAEVRSCRSTLRFFSASARPKV
jgi:hypothetical protein